MHQAKQSYYLTCTVPESAPAQSCGALQAAEGPVYPPPAPPLVLHGPAITNTHTLLKQLQTTQRYL